MKIVTLTTSEGELLVLLPLLRDLFFQSEVELLCLVTTTAEARLAANPACHRELREFTAAPLPFGEEPEGEALREAARRAILEERPDVVMWPPGSPLKEYLKPLLGRYGVGEYEMEGSESAEELLGKLRYTRVAPAPCAETPPDTFLEPHWSKVGSFLQSPCLLQTTARLVDLCKERFPHIEFHQEPKLDRYPQGLSLLGSTFSEHPARELEQLRARCLNSLSLEPVNSPLGEGRHTFRHGLYDNEFNRTPADLDLKDELGEGHHTVIWDARSGESGGLPLPHPDGRYPAFASTWPESIPDWTKRFDLPDGPPLKVVFADSKNVAASVLYHTEAVNRFTTCEAWALSTEPHPFVGPPESNDRFFFTRGKTQPDPALQRVLEESDCIVFFEDDDEHSPNWSFPVHRYVEHVAKVHLYIGYRVHARTPELARPGRTIVTPLPHLLKMYPKSRFYAGFPPLGPDDVDPAPPLSSEDGVCRFLHTPSLPHWTTSRYPYHKDTSAYLEAARILKKRHGSKIEFHQVGGWSQQRVLEARIRCDVTFNQLRGFHGLSGDEAMAVGRPCVQFFDQLNVNRHLEYWGLDARFPWLSCRREKLVDTFEELFLQAEKRAEIGAASRHFMRKYFCPEKGILPLLYHCYGAARRL